MSDSVLPQGKTYEEVFARFRWSVPPTFNIAVAICDRHAGDPARLAMIYEDEAGRVSEHTFAEFRARSNQLARALPAARRQSRRPCRARPVTVPGARRRPSRRVQARGHRAAPRDAVRAGGARVPAARRGRPRRGHGRRQPRSSARREKGLARSRSRHLRRASRRRRRAGLPAASRRRARQLRSRGDGGGGSGVVDLHLRHHRAAEGRAACAPDRHRPPAVDGDGPRVLPQAGRPVLDAGRLGMGRGTSRHAASRLAPRRAGRGASVPEIRRGRRLRSDGAARGAERVPARHRAQDDAEDRRSALPLERQPQDHSLRRRERRRGRDQLGARGARPDAERGVRANRGHSHRRQLLQPHAGQARFHGPPDSRSRDRAPRRGRTRGADRRDRRDLRSTPRSGDVPPLLEQRAGDAGEIQRRLVAAPATWAGRTTTAISGTSGARTMSSRAARIASAPARSRPASSATTRSRWQRPSEVPTRSGARW